MSIGKDQVCVLIPTLNEAPTIGGLVADFISLGFRNILVIDGHSSDGTRRIASLAGARVIEQEGRGKGTAIIEAFGLIEEPYILMVDGDGTYSPQDAERVLAPLASGSAHVIGDRLTGQNRQAFSRLNYFGNQVLNRLFLVINGNNDRHLGELGGMGMECPPPLGCIGRGVSRGVGWCFGGCFGGARSGAGHRGLHRRLYGFGHHLTHAGPEGWAS